MKPVYLALALVLSPALNWAGWPPTAAAQAEAPDQIRARGFFEEGLALAESERWAEALAAFIRSQDLVQRASTSYNIANAFYRLDRPVEGLAELDDYDAMPEVRGDEDARERGRSLRGLLESAVAEVHLAITPVEAQVFIDGRLARDSGLERSIRMNPGPHSLRVTHDSYEPHARELRVERGSRQAHTIALQPLTPVESPSVGVAPSNTAVGLTEVEGSSSRPNRDDRKRFVKRPGFWVMIGAIAAAGIGTGIAVALTRRNEASSCGTTGSCATTQGLTLTTF